jgi:hypothetical protein
MRACLYAYNIPEPGVFVGQGIGFVWHGSYPGCMGGQPRSLSDTSLYANR